MAIAYLGGALVAVVIALAATIHTIPEMADFHSNAFLQRAEKASFKPLGHGLHKMQIYWHMTPFHAEVGCIIKQDVYKTPSDRTICIRPSMPLMCGTSTCRTWTCT